jgi:predicted membrane-bound spermidine synthase
VILYTLFFISGAVALIFETLWFRQAGLTFGNSVWASSLVLSSFMGGLALGNGLAARHGERVRRPLQLYGLLEIVIAAAGVTLVWSLPVLTGWVTPLLRPFLHAPWALNPLRLLVGFALLMAPATAMGATLPILVKAVRGRDPSFGSALGRLYGVNTLGAVVGALAGEAALIGWLGIRGSALFAGGLGLLAAGTALMLARTREQAASAPGTRARSPLPTGARRCLAAAFLSGGILLALEVVWFRFLHLFVHGGSLAFALMLATVLLGIGLGGLVASAWLRRAPGAFRHASPLALVSGCASILVYASFTAVIAPFDTSYVHELRDIFWLTALLTFPVSFLSGVLFTLVGTALYREVPNDTRATGLLTLSNTVGAALGSASAGFVLLPLLGLERSFFLLATLYGVVAALLLRARPDEAAAERPVARYAAAALFGVSLVLFPFGLMEREYLQIPVRRYASAGGSKIVALREGIVSTILYVRRDLFGEPVSLRLLTDGYSMSTTEEYSRRYMKLFVYWPVALRPDPERALLISYGVGATAKALTDTPSLEHIDVVDISPEIIELGEVVYPDPAEHPLRDPRVSVHIEDGRYFLQTTRDRYDLITGEPPPPKVAGVVSLYTREYFQLIRDRLAEGGVNTYWVPAHTLTESDLKAIVRAYCDVFPDCSLWLGTNLDWMLVGSRDARYAPAPDDFVRQWQDPKVASELRALGFERPEQLGALFMADAPQLRRFTRDTLPLVDDFPKRLENALPDPTQWHGMYSRWWNARAARERFRRSRFIRDAWPESLYEASIAAFTWQQMINDSFMDRWSVRRLQQLHEVLTESSLRTLPLWLLGTTGDAIRAVGRVPEPPDPPSRLLQLRAYRALADRDPAVASRYLERASVGQPENPALLFVWLYSLCLEGRLERAEEVARGARDWLPDDGRDASYWEWLGDTFGLRSPHES